MRFLVCGPRFLRVACLLSCVCPRGVVLCSNSWGGLAFVLVGWSCIYRRRVVLYISQSFCGTCLYVFAVGVITLGVKFIIVALALSLRCLLLHRSFWCCLILRWCL
ncbi:hypothetical protein C2G38_907339 [Gigaspora rosea]|uniref:Uncharacterized protein n=1 Tax=Gigaspora rosea TaxID=44941 RepID=A0A397WAY6_9GLOM|nr:hypothetical protein C2G38_907339 [Gigaspora rosea]